MKWQFSRHWVSGNEEQWFLSEEKQTIWALCYSGLLPGRRLQILVQEGGDAQQTLWVKEMQLRVHEDQGKQSFPWWLKW